MCAIYALQRPARDNQSAVPEGTESVHNSFHMDDYLKSSQSVDEATRRAQDLVRVLILDEFTLTKIMTKVAISIQLEHNCKLPENDTKVLSIVGDSSHVLSLQWN